MTKPEIFALPELGNICFALTPFLFSLTSQLLRAISLSIEKASKIVKRYIKERGQATFLQEVYFLRQYTLFLRK